MFVQVFSSPDRSIVKELFWVSNVFRPISMIQPSLLMLCQLLFDWVCSKFFQNINFVYGLVNFILLIVSRISSVQPLAFLHPFVSVYRFHSLVRVIA